MKKILSLFFLLLCLLPAIAAVIPDTQLRYVSYSKAASGGGIVAAKLTIRDDASFGGVTVKSHTYDKATYTGVITFNGPLTSIGLFVADNEKDCLKSVTLPPSVSIIESSAFSACKELEKVEIQGDITEIGSNAFYNCTCITALSFGSQLQTIGSQAFMYCSKLQEIDLGRHLQSIGSKAFNKTAALAKLSCGSHTPATLLGAPYFTVFDADATFRLYVPWPDTEAYSTAWNVSADRINGVPFAACFKVKGKGSLEIDGEKYDSEYVTDISGPCTINVDAQPNFGYSFSQWDDGITASHRSFNFPSDCTDSDVYTASFVKIEGYRLSVQPYVLDHGRVEGTINGVASDINDCIVVFGATVNLKATPATGYRFLRWSDGVTMAERSFENTDNEDWIELYAYFVPTDLQPVIDAFVGEYEQMFEGVLLHFTVSPEGKIVFETGDGEETMTITGDLNNDFIGVRTTPYGYLAHVLIETEEEVAQILPIGVLVEDGRTKLMLFDDFSLYPVDGSPLGNYMFDIDEMIVPYDQTPRLDDINDPRHATTAILVYHDRVRDVHLCLYNVDWDCNNLHKALEYDNFEYASMCQNFIVECHGRNMVDVIDGTTAFSCKHLNLVFSLPEPTDELTITGCTLGYGVDYTQLVGKTQDVIARGKGTLRILTPKSDYGIHVNKGGFKVEGGAQVQIVSKEGITASRMPFSIDAQSSLTCICDCDGSRKIDFDDHAVIINALLGLDKTTPVNRLDVNGDGRVSVTDAVKMVEYLKDPWK